MEAFAAAPYEVQLVLFPFLAANVAALDRLLGPLSARDTAAAAAADAERRHRELLGEIRRANADQVNLLLRQTARQLAQGFRLLGVALPPGAVVPAAAPAPARGDDGDDDNEEEEEEEDEA